MSDDLDQWLDENKYRRYAEYKISKLTHSSVYPLISSIITHYNFLKEYEDIQTGNPFHKFVTWIRRTAFRKIVPYHNRILEKAIQKAISEHYDDGFDNNLAQYMKTYVSMKKNNI